MPLHLNFFKEKNGGGAISARQAKLDYTEDFSLKQNVFLYAYVNCKYVKINIFRMDVLTFWSQLSS